MRPLRCWCCRRSYRGSSCSSRPRARRRRRPHARARCSRRATLRSATRRRTQPLEVGVKLQSDEDGYITALRFYKQPNNTGRHVGHLWSASGQLLGEAEFANETASGWQEAAPGLAGGDHARHDVRRLVPLERGFFALQSGRAQPGHPPRTAARPRAIRRSAATGSSSTAPSGFPTDSWNATSYWVDAVFTRTPPLDTRPPEITASHSGRRHERRRRSPPRRRSASTSRCRRRASRPATFTLRDGAGNLVAATISYDAQTRKATLSPQSPLQHRQHLHGHGPRRYERRHRQRGQPARGRQVMELQHAGGVPVHGVRARPGPARAASASGDPLEVGMKFRADEDGFVTALRFYKQADNTGTHVGHLWSAGGQLLGEVEFTDETASGWQQETLPVPVAVTKDTTYVVSYHSSSGRHRVQPRRASRAGVDRPPLHAPADQVVGGNGVYRYGASGFPTDTFGATNYWVDVSFDRGGGRTRARRASPSVSPRRERDRRGESGQRHGHLRRAAQPEHRQQRRGDARGRHGRARGRHGQLRRAGPHDHPDAAVAARARQGLHGHRPERHRRRHRRRRQPPRGGRGLELQHLGELPVHGLQAERGSARGRRRRTSRSRSG